MFYPDPRLCGLCTLSLRSDGKSSKGAGEVRVLCFHQGLTSCLRLFVDRRYTMLASLETTIDVVCIRSGDNVRVHAINSTFILCQLLSMLSSEI